MKRNDKKPDKKKRNKIAHSELPYGGSNSFQHIPRLTFKCIILTTLYQLMLQPWYQKPAQSLKNTLLSFP